MEFEELKRVGTLCQTGQRAHPLGLSQEKNAKKSNWQEVSQLVINKHGWGISSTTRGCRETTASSSNGASETRDHRITSPTLLTQQPGLIFLPWIKTEYCNWSFYFRAWLSFMTSNRNILMQMLILFSREHRSFSRVISREVLKISKWRGKAWARK